MEDASPEVALANHLIAGPVILARGLDGRVPYAVKIHGSALEYVVKRGDRKIATITRQWFRLADTYWIRIDDTEKDPIIVLAIAVVIEVVCNRRHNY